MHARLFCGHAGHATCTQLARTSVLWPRSFHEACTQLPFWCHTHHAHIGSLMSFRWNFWQKSRKSRKRAVVIHLCFGPFCETNRGRGPPPPTTANHHFQVAIQIARIYPHCCKHTGCSLNMPLRNPCVAMKVVFLVLISI